MLHEKRRSGTFVRNSRAFAARADERRPSRIATTIRRKLISRCSAVAHVPAFALSHGTRARICGWEADISATTVSVSWRGEHKRRNAAIKAAATTARRTRRRQYRRDRTAAISSAALSVGESKCSCQVVRPFREAKRRQFPARNRAAASACESNPRVGRY